MSHPGRLCATALIVAVAAACTSAPTQTASPGGRRLAAPEASSPFGARKHCRVVRPPAHSQVADASWKQRIVSAAAKHSVGIAIGIHGTPVFLRDGARPRVPASNEKLLLTMALFDEVGPSFRIPTKAESASKPAGGVVRGDLWLVGGGDPSLTDHQKFYWGSEFHATSLRDLARRIARSGVVRVTGRVMGATSYFAHDLMAPGWHSFVPHSYVEPLTSLSVNGNNAVRRHPERKAADVLTKELEKHGVSVAGPAGSAKPPAGLVPVAAVRSETLQRLVRFMDETSNNFFAEMFGKLLGARTFGPPGTIAKGARAIEQWASRNGERVVANDSSGLSFQDRVSPLAMVRLLGAAGKESWLDSLRSDLPSAGQGTLRYRLPGVKVKAKTGTLFAGASALSGWVRSRGRWVEFSILDNKTPKTVEDKIVRIVSRAHVTLPPGPHRTCTPTPSTPTP